MTQAKRKRDKKALSAFKHQAGNIWTLVVVKDGYAFYFKEGELMASPFSLDGVVELENELFVDDFVEPLTAKDRAEIETALRGTK